MPDVEMRTRRFTIGDGMIFVATTALGLAWSGRAWPVSKAAMTTQTFASWAYFWEFVLSTIVLILPCLLCWTVTIFCFRVRRPRPSWRKISRQPGMASAISVLFLLALVLPIVAVLVAAQIRQTGITEGILGMIAIGLIELLAMATPILGFIVMLAWLLLFLQRGWRCERSWIDRSGRAIGLLWIAVGSVVGAELFRRFL